MLDIPVSPVLCWLGHENRVSDHPLHLRFSYKSVSRWKSNRNSVSIRESMLPNTDMQRATLLSDRNQLNSDKISYFNHKLIRNDILKYFKDMIFGTAVDVFVLISIVSYLPNKSAVFIKDCVDVITNLDELISYFTNRARKSGSNGLSTK